MNAHELHDTTSNGAGIDRGRGIATDGGVQVGTPGDINTGNTDFPVFGGHSVKWDYRENQSPIDEENWREMDELMVEAAQDEFTLFDRLRSRNLVDSVPLETTISMWSEMSGFGEAEVDMDGRSQTVEDLPPGDFDRGVPIPLIAAAFRLGHRGPDATQDMRDTGIDGATRAVMEEMERFIVRGWERNVTDGEGDTFTLYGVTNHPDRNTLAGTADWDDETNRDIEQDILNMVEALEGDNFSGPYDLWLNSSEVARLRDASPNYDNQRIRETIDDLPEVDNIVVSNYIPENEGVMVDLQRQVIDAKLSDGNVTDVAEWENTPMETQFKVYSGFAPRVKSRPVTGADTRESGVAHITGI